MSSQCLFCQSAPENKSVIIPAEAENRGKIKSITRTNFAISALASAALDKWRIKQSLLEEQKDTCLHPNL